MKAPRLLLLFSLLLSVSPRAVSAQQAFDCGLRNLSLHFARAVQPARAAAAFAQLADALAGSPQFGSLGDCNLSAAVPPAGAPNRNLCVPATRGLNYNWLL